VHGAAEGSAVHNGRRHQGRLRRQPQPARVPPHQSLMKAGDRQVSSLLLWVVLCSAAAHYPIRSDSEFFSPQESSAAGEGAHWSWMSLPAMLPGETVLEIAQGSQLVRDIVAVAHTVGVTSREPKPRNQRRTQPCVLTTYVAAGITRRLLQRPEEIESNCKLNSGLE
jgi:hypothetical protein